MTKTLLKWTLLLLLMAYTGWMTIWARQQADLHVCEGFDIHVFGTSNLARTVGQGVEAELRKYPVRIIGTPIRLLDLRKIESSLASMNNFESVDCMIDANNRLRVNVVPMVPVMRVFSGNSSYYINRQGKRIDAKAEFFSDVPVVHGNFSKSFSPKEVIPLVNFIRNDKMMKNLTSMVEARDRDNLIIIPRVYGHVINMGDTSRLADKAHALSLFYRQVLPHKGWKEYDTISVKYRGQVVASRRNKNTVVHSEQTDDDVDLEELTLPDVSENLTETNKTL